MEQRNCRQSFSEQMQCILGHQSTWNQHNVFYILANAVNVHEFPAHIFYHLGCTTWSVWRLVPLIFFFLSLKKPLNEDWRKHPYILKRTVTQTHRTSGLWSREQCSARPSDRSPSFTFSLPVFYLPLSSLCSIPSGPGPEQLSSASTDSSWTHTHTLYTQ